MSNDETPQADLFKRFSSRRDQRGRLGRLASRPGKERHINGDSLSPKAPNTTWPSGPSTTQLMRKRTEVITPSATKFFHPFGRSIL